MAKEKLKTKTKPKTKLGRPAKLNEKVVTPSSLKKLAMLGATNSDLVEIYGVSIECFRNFLKRNPELLDTLKNDKEKADNQVEAALYTRALGFSHPEVKVFYNSQLDRVVEHTVQKYYPPSEVACIFWLKNRQPQKWRELQEFAGKMKHEGEMTMTHVMKPEDVTDDVRQRVRDNLGILQRYGALGSGVGQN